MQKNPKDWQALTDQPALSLGVFFFPKAITTKPCLNFPMDQPEIVVEFILHADLSRFELSAHPDKGKMNYNDVINALEFAIEQVKERMKEVEDDPLQSAESNGTHWNLKGLDLHLVRRNPNLHAPILVRDHNANSHCSFQGIQQPWMIHACSTQSTLKNSFATSAINPSQIKPSEPSNA